MNKLRLLIIAVVVIVLVFAAQCLYTVKPYQDVVQLRFGRMVQPYRVFESYNLFLKWPSFIDRYVPIDKRLQVTDAVLETINTSGRQDQNFQIAAACSGFWQVKDKDRFYTSLLAAVKEPLPEPGGSFPKSVNDKIRNTIRSSVNNVFGETQLSQLFGLPELTGVISQDCLSIDAEVLLPKGLSIRGGEIKRSDENEIAVVADDGQVQRLDSSQRQSTSCIDIILYGYLREPPQAGSAERVLYRWVIKPDPAGAEGLARNELRLTIPLKYIAQQKTTPTVQIDRIQQTITQRVSLQTMADYGVQVVQVDIRRLSFPASSLESVYKKMKSERRRIVDAYVSSGNSQADIIRSRARLISSQMVSAAEGQARAITGEADARAAKIAAEVQQLDPEFYNWLQSLETAAEILKNKAWVVLSTEQPVMEALLGKAVNTMPETKEPIGNAP